MKLQHGLRRFADRFITRSCFLGTLASLLPALNASAETFELTTATIADINKAFDSGAIILAKLNMSEFASGDAMNSLDGPTYNPHDPARTPSGSSGGTGAAIAAAYASVGLGSDTGGSVRGPSSANGIVGLKPTLAAVALWWLMRSSGRTSTT